MAFYYVDGAVGDNGNAGTSEGAGNAWATIEYGMYAATGGTVWIKNSTTYLEAIRWTGSTYRLNSSPVALVGYDTVTGDNGQITMSGGGGRQSAFSGSLQTANFGVFNFKMIDYPGYGMHNTLADGGCVWNCEISGCSLGGIYADREWSIVGCHVHHNGDGSRAAIFTNHGSITYCKVHNNNGGGIRINELTIFKRCFIHNCLVAKNTNGAQIESFAGQGIRVWDCTIDGNNVAVGIKCSSTGMFGGPSYLNNIIYSCTTGITSSDNTPDGTMALGYVEMNNLFYGNGEDYHNQGMRCSPWSGKSWFVTGTDWPANNIYDEDPLFTDPANLDYTLQAGSPAIDAGTDARCSEIGPPKLQTSPQDIGAFKSYSIAITRSVYGG